MPEPYEAVGFVKWQWFEEDGINDAEDRGVGSDADGKRKKRRRREHGRVQESAEDVFVHARATSKRFTTFGGTQKFDFIEDPSGF